MLDIIEHLSNKKIIDKNKIIYLDKNIIYHFHSITFIRNLYHGIDYQLTDTLSKFIDKYIVIDRENKVYYKTLNLPENLDNICIIKSNSSVKLTDDGVFPIDSVKSFCNKCNLILVKPGQIHEICLIHYIHQCKNLIISWGSTFQKNSTYISEKCEKIIVLILENSPFVGQYYGLKNANVLITKFRNANVEYRIVNQNLEFQLF
jgi:hypothetical protein